ncbi:hypothetical protein AB0A84_25800 [Streptomyces albidoflavus]|uniref:hypothetical protein n=1 Tax=Streptomyces albidoflavus TaxID=1886 RepID=UPI0033D2E29F
MSNTMQAEWTWKSRSNGFPQAGPLWLSPILWSQELFEEHEDPVEAIGEYLLMIRSDYPNAREVPLSWQVANSGERAPFQIHNGEIDGMRIVNGSFDGDNFLHYFTWPESRTTGEQTDWYRLPVKAGRGDRMWAVLDWLPLPLQRTVSVDVLGLLVRRSGTTADAAAEPMATQKQISYLTSLLGKAGREVGVDEIHGLSKAEAHRRISALVKQQDT